MLCVFCDENVDQLCDSHIIPKAWLGKSDEKGMPVEISSAPYAKRRPNGPYQSKLLCRDCESMFSTIEKSVTEKTLRSSGKFNSGRKIYDGLCTQELVAFLLSILWRAHHSTIEFFSKVRLGPYEPQIKSHLQRYFDVGTELSSPAWVKIGVQEFEKSVPILDPAAIKLEGVNFWNVYAARFKFWIKLDKRPLPSDFAGLFLGDGDAVTTFPKDWWNSKERQIMSEMYMSLAKDPWSHLPRNPRGNQS